MCAVARDAGAAILQVYGDEDFGETDEEWYAGVPDHIFEVTMEVNTYNLKKSIS